MTSNPIEICVRPHNGGFMAYAPGDEDRATWGYSRAESISNYIIGRCKVTNIPAEGGRDEEGWDFGNHGYGM